MPPKSSVGFVLSSLLLSFSALAQVQQTQPWDAPAFSATPESIIEAASRVTGTKTDDSIVLLKEDRYAFDAQGKSVYTHRIVAKIVTEGGIEQWKSLSADYEPWHQQKPVLQARVINPDRSVHTLDPKTIAEDTAQSDDEDIYTDDRVVRAPLPALSVGTVLEQQVTITDTTPLFEGGVIHEVNFGYRVPSLESRLIVDVPTGTRLNHEHQLLPQLVVQTTESGGRSVTTFSNGRMEPVEDAEEDLPGDIPSWPHITFALGKSWQQVASSYSTTVDEKIANADVKRFVDAATKTEKDRVKIADSLVAQLHKEVRYTGIEFGQSALIPHPPAETLKHRFGDCKDKAALLVAMLRAAGIPAYLALLNTGPGEDVPQDLAGMGMFDHAIVYSPGSPDLWIDATAEFMTIGQIPSMDQGRRALVVRPQTTALQLIPELPSSADRVVETREFFLPEDGAARVVETTEWFGLSASSLRHDYGSAISKEFRKKLDEYMKDTYLAEKMEKLDFSDPHDVSKPFSLHLEAVKAKRGSVDENEAVVAMPRGAIFGRLPAFMQSDVEPDDPAKKTPEGESKYKPRKSDLILPESSILEWRYKITPPPAFVARSLPKNETRSFGPAVMTSEFSQSPDNSVTVIFRFDTVKRRWTAAEVEEARKAIRAFYKQDMVNVHFDHKGLVALQSGRVKDALSIYSGLVALHPKESLHHTQIARAYLIAGLGDEARAEAERAVKLDPSSARAYKTLGWILQHDLVGRRLKTGFDLAGSVAAYRKAKQLDPDDVLIPTDLAILLDYNAAGVRYGTGADLQAAAAEYEAVAQKTKDKSERIIDNPLWTLTHAGQYRKIKEMTGALPSTAARNAFSIFATAMIEGVEPALKEATRLTGDEASRSKGLATAGERAVEVREYGIAADLLSAAAAGQEQAASQQARAEFMRKSKRYEQVMLPPSDARYAVQHFLLSLFQGDEHNDLMQGLSRFHYTDKTKDDVFKQTHLASRQTRNHLIQNGTAIETIADIALSNMQSAAEGNDKTGYRVKVQPLGAAPQTYFVLKEEGSYKILGNDSALSPVGPYLLRLLENGDADAARLWLDWIRELIKRSGGDDRFAGRPFPLFWTKGQTADVDQMRVAAAALTTEGEYAMEAIPILVKARERVTSDSVRSDFDFALATAYSKTEKFDELLKTATLMASAEPTSVRAFEYQVEALERLSRYDDALQLAQERLKRMTEDVDAMRALARVGINSGQPAECRAWERKIIDAGKGTVDDFNLEAWSSLFDGKTDDNAVSEARRGVALTKNNSAPIIHTLASIYADQGKTSEARELILKALDLWGYDQPNSEAWFVFGRIAEQYGNADAARKAYARVDKKDYKIMTGGSTYVLVQRRLAALGSSKTVVAAASVTK